MKTRVSTCRKVVILLVAFALALYGVAVPTAPDASAADADPSVPHLSSIFQFKKLKTPAVEGYSPKFIGERYTNPLTPALTTISVSAHPLMLATSANLSVPDA